MQIVDFHEFKWDKAHESLNGLFSLFERHPNEFGVRSPRTGKVVTFKAITPEDDFFDEDHWDGEYACYRPTEKLNGINVLWLSNGA